VHFLLTDFFEANSLIGMEPSKIALTRDEGETYIYIDLSQLLGEQQLYTSPNIPFLGSVVPIGLSSSFFTNAGTMLLGKLGRI
jgi:hypothetical protein